MDAPLLHMLCGKIAAGKSTLAAELGARPGHVLIAEDEWLGGLFGDLMGTPQDFLRYSATLRAVMAPHVVDLLRSGVSVVLDFQANTLESRAWLRELCADSGAAHQMHVLSPPDDVCLARLKARNAEGAHPFAVTEEQYWRFAAHFVPPTPKEGFTLVLYDQAQ